MDFKNKKDRSMKIALVLGSSEGLGYACAEALLKNNVKVCILSRNKNKLSNAVKKLSKINQNNVFSIKGDIKNEETLSKAKKLIEEKWGEVNILINSNGGPKSGKVTELSDNDWTEGLNAYALPVFRAIRIFNKGMIKSNWGRIITIGSIAAKEPIDNLDISNFIRSGFLGLHKSLANDLAKHNINVHCILPGSIMTSRTKDRISDRANKLSISIKESMLISEKKIRKGRIGEPKDVGNLVAFLCSIEADYLTGGSYMVDGGMSNSI
jgi:3-oxoacyl-[acyl-carrier protein] reductase